MKIKCLIPFASLQISMSKNQIADFDNEELAKEFIRAGFIEEVKEVKTVKTTKKPTKKVGE